MRKINFTLDKLFSLLDNLGYILLGAALSAYAGTPSDIGMAVKFLALGAASLVLSYLLGLINADSNNNDCTKVIVVMKKAKGKKKKKKNKKKK